MDAWNINETERVGGAEGSVCVASVSDRFAERGLIASVRLGAKQQIEREEQTRALDPQAYRLSQMSQAALNGQYRRGKETMSSDDVLRYFGENRRRHVQTADFEGNTGIDECEADPVTKKSLVWTQVASKKTLRELPQGVKRRVIKTTKRLMTQTPKWMDFSRADASREKRRFPLSAFVAVIVIALCLMLIVASSVMLTRAESEVSSLNKEIDDTSAEIAKLRSDVEAENDLLEIRRIAVEEYGMVDEEFVKMEYMEGSSEDSVESFEETPRETVGLDAILSAIGLK
ncbi:MAG: hypothetical protein IJW49_02850 [Clostridia bacterium]|nr:hypothetical protein [Clostridia bacterium]